MYNTSAYDSPRSIEPLDGVVDEDGLALSGLMVRHFVMPGLVEDTRAIAQWVAQLSPDTYFNVMDQYRPDHSRTPTGRDPLRHRASGASRDAHTGGGTRRSSRRTNDWHAAGFLFRCHHRPPADASTQLDTSSDVRGNNRRVVAADAGPPRRGPGNTRRGHPDRVPSPVPTL